MKCTTSQIEASNLFTELVEFKLKNGAKEKDFLEANDRFHQQIFEGTKGFVNRQLLKSDDGSWALIVRFEKSDYCKQAGEKIKKNMDSFDIFDYIDTKTMNFRYFTEKRDQS